MMEFPRCGAVGAACAIWLSTHTAALQATTFGRLLRQQSLLPIPATPACPQAAGRANARAGAEHSPFPSPSPQTPSPAQLQPLLGFRSCKDESKGLCLQELEQCPPVPLRLEGAHYQNLPGSPAAPHPASMPSGLSSPLPSPSGYPAWLRGRSGCSCPQGSSHTALRASSGATNRCKP